MLIAVVILDKWTALWVSFKVVSWMEKSKTIMSLFIDCKVVYRDSDVSIQVSIAVWLWRNDLCISKLHNAMFLFRVHLTVISCVIHCLWLSHNFECNVGLICCFCSSVCPIASMMVIPYFCLNNRTLWVSCFRIYSILMDAGECEILIILNILVTNKKYYISMYKGNISLSPINVLVYVFNAFNCKTKPPNVNVSLLCVQLV